MLNGSISSHGGHDRAQGRSLGHDPVPEDLGAYLAALRATRGLTQAELAAELGLSRRYVYEIEADRPNLYARRVFEIINHLEATLTIAATSDEPR